MGAVARVFASRSSANEPKGGEDEPTDGSPWVPVGFTRKVSGCLAAAEEEFCDVDEAICRVRADSRSCGVLSTRGDDVSLLNVMARRKVRGIMEDTELTLPPGYLSAADTGRAPFCTYLRRGRRDGEVWRAVLDGGGSCGSKL